MDDSTRGKKGKYNDRKIMKLDRDEKERKERKCGRQNDKRRVK